MAIIGEWPRLTDAAREKLARLQREDEEETQARCIAVAREAGFSSYEEYSKHLDEDLRKATEDHRKSLEAQGINWNDYWENHPQQEKKNRCHCDYHTIMGFCVTSLDDYCSQDDPDLLSEYEQMTKQNMNNVHVEPGSESRRLGSKSLERYWETLGDREPHPVIPLWRVQADYVLWRIERQSRERLGNELCDEENKRNKELKEQSARQTAAPVDTISPSPSLGGGSSTPEGERTGTKAAAFEPKSTSQSPPASKQLGAHEQKREARGATINHTQLLTKASGVVKSKKSNKKQLGAGVVAAVSAAIGQ